MPLEKSKKTLTQTVELKQNGNTLDSTVAAETLPNRDPFTNLETLRLNQGFRQTVGATRTQLVIPVRKPSRQDWVRVHPDPSYRLETCVLELKEERETYLVSQSLWSEIADDISPRVLYTAITRQGTLFVWPVRMPGNDGRTDRWSESALTGADLATKLWIRLSANMQSGGYDVFEAAGKIPDPVWPDIPLSDILRRAFSNAFIEDIDHPVLQKLRGEV
jgi:hypothetical protein